MTNTVATIICTEKNQTGFFAALPL